MQFPHLQTILIFLANLILASASDGTVAGPGGRHSRGPALLGGPKARSAASSTALERRRFRNEKLSLRSQLS